MTNGVVEAYQWWNVLNDDASNLQKAPECIMPQKAYIVWSNICPYFQNMPIDHTDVQKYWEFIQKLVTVFLPGDTIPNPISHFPQFIQKIYSIRDLMLPKSVSSCLKFVDVCQPANPATFCFNELPIFFLDPLIYFQTLIALKHTNQVFWKSAISNTKVVDAFFDMHSNFMTPLPSFSDDDFWNHRLYLSEVLFQLIESIIVGNNSSTILKNHPKAYQFSTKFCECCIKLISTAPLSTSVVFFRYIIRILKLTQNKITPDQLKSLSVQFLVTLDKADSILAPLALKFVFRLKPQVIPNSRVIRMISNRGIRSIADIEIVSSFGEGSTVLPIIIFLCRSAVSSKLWHRACISEIISLLMRHAGRNDVRDWFQLFIRRLFIFIAISSAKMRYRTRTLLLSESLASLMTIRLLWLQQAILISASSIFSTKSVPPYFKNFFPIAAPVDDVIVHEYESFLSAVDSFNFKVFPFDPKKGTLALPPLVDLYGGSNSNANSNCNASFNVNSNSNFNFNGNSNFSSNTNANNNVNICPNIGGYGSQMTGSQRAQITKSTSSASAKMAAKSANGSVSRFSARNEKLSGRSESGGMSTSTTTATTTTSASTATAAAAAGAAGGGGRVSVRTTQKKRPEPLIKKPGGGGAKATRPLASAICITPVHRR